MLTLESRAAAVASAKHAGQMYGDGPYTDHLDHVARVLRDHGWGEDDETMATGRLHDTREDTNTTDEEIRSGFGDRVATNVDYVTTPEGRNRRERVERLLRRLKALVDEDPETALRVLAVKLADRIANVEASWEAWDSRLFMYHREYPAFREALRRDDQDPRLLAMWAELDKFLGWYDPKR